MSGLSQWAKKYSHYLLMLGYAIAYLLPLNSRSLWIPDEARYAEISREMIQSGDWIVPRLLGLDYFEKPVAGYWLNNLSQLVFGENNFAVRFASALCTGLTAWLIFWFTQQIFQSRQKALSATVIYLSFLIVYCIGNYSVLDAIVTLWISATVVAFYWSLRASERRQKLIGYGLMGVAAGLGFLTKGFIALVVPFAVAMPYLTYRRCLSELRYLGIALVTLLVISLPWAIAVHIRAPDFWHYFIWIEHIQRFIDAPVGQHNRPFFYYLPILLAGSLPWLGLMPAALKQNWTSLNVRPDIVFLLCWLLLPLLFFSLSKGKLPTYILPCFAPLAILLGNGLVELLSQQTTLAIRINGWINMLFGVVVGIVVILIESGVALNKDIYSSDETPTLVLMIGIFLCWAIMGFLSVRKPNFTLWLTALCPLAFGLLIGWAIPKVAIYSKQPAIFINDHHSQLSHSKFVLSNDVGLAHSLAWELKRDDIRLYNAKGEMTYGLQQSSQSDKSIDDARFAAWLTAVRSEGDIALVSRSKSGELPPDLPVADEVITEHRFTLFLYHQITP